MFGCPVESMISQIPQQVLVDPPNAANGYQAKTKPQRKKGSVWTLANKTISSEDVVQYRQDIDKGIFIICFFIIISSKNENIKNIEAVNNNNQAVF